MTDLYCPFCGSKHYHPYGNQYENRYECEECGWFFDAEEIDRQNIRHQISCLLDGTSEEKPKEIYFMIPTAEEEACGLSSLEMPHIDMVFEVDGEGTMWFHEEGENEINTKEPVWRDLDELSLQDLQGLLDYLRNQ